MKKKLKKIREQILRFIRILRYGDGELVSFFDIKTSERVKINKTRSLYFLSYATFKYTLQALRKNFSSFLNEEILLIPDFLPSAPDMYAKYSIDHTFKNSFSTAYAAQGDLPMTVHLSEIETIRLFIGCQKLSSRKGSLQVFLEQKEQKQMILHKKISSLENHWDLFEFKFPSSFNVEDAVTMSWKVDHNDSRVCISSPIIRKKKQIPQMLLVFILDALRPNDLGIYNPMRTETPAIDHFFKKGIYYKNSFAQSNWTLPTFASMSLSRYASNHNVVDPDRYSSPLSRTIPTLAELFRNKGFYTYASVSHRRCNQALGHHRGFEHFSFSQTVEGKYNSPGEKGPNNVYLELRELKNYLRNFSDIPFFGFVHIFDTHFPYLHSSGRQQKNYLLFQETINHYVKRSFQNNLNAEDFAFLDDCYRDKLREVDQELGEVFSLLEKRENVSVILTSDHGYSFTHPLGNNLSDEEIRTPFLLYSNEFPLQNGECDELLESSIDLLPTLSSLYHLNDVSFRHGSSLFDADGVQNKKDYAIAELVYLDSYQLKIIDRLGGYILFASSRERATSRINLENIHILQEERHGIARGEFYERIIIYLNGSKIDVNLKEKLIQCISRHSKNFDFFVSEKIFPKVKDFSVRN